MKVEQQKEYEIGQEYYLYKDGKLLTGATWVDDKWNGECFLAIPKNKKADPRAVWVIWADDVDLVIKKQTKEGEQSDDK